MASQVDLAFLDGPVSQVAQRLIGCVLERNLDGQTIKVKIVETEAYDETDIASHSYKGRTQRTDVMFGPSGHLYVYFTYGMHFCCNVVVGPEGYGAAVLIRAVEPIIGTDFIESRRGMQGTAATNGPAKLCQALAIDKVLNGHNLSEPPLQLIVNDAVHSNDIIQTTRIGLTKGKDTRWRFYLKDNPFVSNPL